MARYTRRYVLGRWLTGLSIGALLVACGESGRGSVSPTQQALPDSVRPAASTVQATATTASTAVAQPPITRTVAPATPSVRPKATDVALQPEGCIGPTAERIAYSFADKVRNVVDYVVLGTVREIGPARWSTADGRRPSDPKNSDEFIFTPVRIAIERVARGTYPLPEMYFAVLGGQVGGDCQTYTGSGSWPEFWIDGRFFYFVDYRSSSGSREGYADLWPVPGDSRYRYHRVASSYRVTPAGLVTIEPEYDIMGGRVDYPPRTLTVAQVLDEIAALLAAPATPTR